jgi:hypothetical protein
MWLWSELESMPMADPYEYNNVYFGSTVLIQGIHWPRKRPLASQEKKSAHTVSSDPLPILHGNKPCHLAYYLL